MRQYAKVFKKLSNIVSFNYKDEQNIISTSVKYYNVMNSIN